MVETEVDVAIRNLKQDAAENKIFTKASDIAENLGVKYPKPHGSWFEYDTGSEWKIEYDDYGHNLFVYYQNVLVYEAQLGETRSYRRDMDSGLWIAKLTKIYEEKVLPKILADRKKQQEAEDLELLERWGIKRGA